MERMSHDSEKSYELRFEMAADGIANASRLYQRTQYQLITLAGTLALLMAALLALFETELWFVVFLVLFGIFALAMTLTSIPLRWGIRRRARRLLDTTATVVIDESGLSTDIADASAHIAWGALTDVRVNDQVVLILRDRLPCVWIPTSAFSSIAQRDQIVAFIREQIAAARMAPSTGG